MSGQVLLDFRMLSASGMIRRLFSTCRPHTRGWMRGTMWSTLCWMPVAAVRTRDSIQKPRSAARLAHEGRARRYLAHTSAPPDMRRRGFSRTLRIGAKSGPLQWPSSGSACCTGDGLAGLRLIEVLGDQARHEEQQDDDEDFDHFFHGLILSPMRIGASI